MIFFANFCNTSIFYDTLEYNRIKNFQIDFRRKKKFSQKKFRQFFSVYQILWHLDLLIIIFVHLTVIFVLTMQTFL